MDDNIISLNYPFINHEKEMYIEKNLKKYLVTIQKANLFNQLSYILKEMIGNANKANLKRIHFKMKKLDINSDDQYNEGIKTFKMDMSKLHQEYYKAAENEGHFIKIDLFSADNNFIMKVTNDTMLLPIEKERIDEKMKSAKKFSSVEEALTEGLDTTEGGGLGLILTLLMLRKIGLNEEIFTIESKENHTLVEIKIPLSLLNKEQEEFIADTVKKEIEEIPQFPQHIIDLQKMLNNPNANFDDLAHIIHRDTSLIADLLKLANSSFYMMPHKIKTIEEAVRQIGFKGIKSLILAYSAQKLLSEKYDYDQIKTTIDHSAEVAFFAYELARKLKIREIIDETYTAAILHDFGKIIINSLKPNVIGKIAKICNKKGIDNNVIENLTDGFNHSIIGASLAEKWQFPNNIMETIRFHHTPLEASDENKNLVNIIYLANIIFYYLRDEYLFTKINFQVLKEYNLTDEKAFDILVKSLGQMLETRKNKP